MRSTEVITTMVSRHPAVRQRAFATAGPAACENPPMRTLLRRAVVVAILAGVVLALWRARRPAPAPALPHHPLTIPPGVDPEGGPEVDGDLAGITPWVEPEASTCPASHPVKAKLASGIFHVPGGLSYDRTRPDRCYLDADAATADGLRQAKR
jgi:hypothetical protein